MVFQSLDLFSGIGGLTLALEGVAKPVAYCEVASGPIQVLNARMSDKSLPSAPICKDIRMLDKRWLRKHAPGSKPNAVVAGFPCIGFSCAGRQEGFANEQSALFFEMLRVVDEFRVKTVFLENVPNLLRSGMKVVVEEFVKKRGFELRWCLLSACQVGAPHKRTRWYCIASKPGVKHVPFPVQHTPFNWRHEPCRMILQRTSGYLDRMHMLGNAVVPQAARTAYYHILYARTVAEASLCQKTMPSHGYIGVDGVTRHLETPEQTCRSLDLLLMPDAYKASSRASKLFTTELCKHPTKIRLWATPTSGNMRGSSNYLTKRCKSQLQTQLRFERKTPSHLRSGVASPKFVEWMMGYKKGWTR